MHLVTVTCNRDFNQMLLQAESINKFIKPYCHHYVIVNEPNPDLAFWFNWLSPYYTNHKLHVIPRIEYDYKKLGVESNYSNTYFGWKIQQLQKMLIAYLLNDDYILLDSKNFFIREANIDDWCDAIGTTVSDKSATYKKSSECYAEYFNVPEMEKIFHAYTPFVVKRKFITDNKNFDFFTLAEALWYPSLKDVHISEFTFYSYLVGENPLWNQEAPSMPNAKMFFDKNDYTTFPNDMFIELIKSIQNPEINVLGIHQRLLSQMDKSGLNAINMILKSKLNLETKLLPVPPENVI